MSGSLPEDVLIKAPIHLSREEHQKLKKLAQTENVTISRLIERVLRGYLEMPEKK